jgi:D-glycero-alpha-D-manno-heptose-7-phosphate kinase
MIITRSPLKICLGGGGTDLPTYYRQYTGFEISSAIKQALLLPIQREKPRH